MTATVEQLVVNRPGVYQMPAEVYHGDPVEGGSLSASGVRDLLPPSCPALYRYKRDHGAPPRKTFELGHAAHSLVLGAGPQPVLVDKARWDTNEIKARLAEVRAAGDVPLKRDEMEQVHAMAEALRRHADAAALFAPGSGVPEQSLFWEDTRYGLWRRRRLDWLPNLRPDGRMILADYKTCVCAAPDKISRAMDDFGYHTTAAWSLDAVVDLGLAPPGRGGAAFLLVFQEKTPPYLVNVVQPDPAALRIGRARNREAMRIYRECVETGDWPGYSDVVEFIGLPPWVEAQYPREAL